MELQPYIFFYGRPNKTWGQNLSIELNDYPPSTDSRAATKTSATPTIFICSCRVSLRMAQAPR
jgi:hypothetical protein